MSTIADNPFYVLEVPRTASPTEVERQGQKLLAMLEVGVDGSQVYPTPLGERPRDPDLVRRSLDELRDPVKRAVHEVWATLDPSVEAALERDVDPAPASIRWRDAFVALGWRA